MFENLPYLTLMLVIKLDFIKCDVLSKDKYLLPVIISLVTAFFSLIMTLV